MVNAAVDIFDYDRLDTSKFGDLISEMELIKKEIDLVSNVLKSLSLTKKSLKIGDTVILMRKVKVQKEIEHLRTFRAQLDALRLRLNNTIACLQVGI